MRGNRNTIRIMSITSTYRAHEPNWALGVVVFVVFVALETEYPFETVLIGVVDVLALVVGAIIVWEIFERNTHITGLEN